VGALESKKRINEPFFYVGNSTGVILIHGFTGSPSELRFLGECLAAEGWTVLGVRLAGHGTTPEELAKTSWEDWVKDAEEGVNKLRQTCERVIGVGFSMGGLITLHMSSLGLLDGVITMNAPMILQDWGARLARFYKPFFEYVNKPKSHLKEQESVTQGHSERFTYERVPVACIESVNQAIRQVAKELQGITVPTLLMQSRQDKTVNPVSVVRIQEGLTRTSPEIITFEKSGHVLPLGPERREVAVRVAGFIRRIEGSGRGPVEFA
jgi:carboxylesterase